MIKKVSIIALTLAISLDSVIVYAGRSKKTGGKKRANALAKVKKSNKMPAPAPIVENNVSEELPATEVAPAPVTPTQKVTIIDNSVTNDLDAIRSAVRDEIQANNQSQAEASALQAQELLAKIEADNKAKANQKIKEASNLLFAKIEEVRSECSGIKSNIDTIFGLTVATTVSSGLGTAAAGGALAVGLVKANNDKKAEEQGTANEKRDYSNEYSEWKKQYDIASSKWTPAYRNDDNRTYSDDFDYAKGVKDLLSAVNQENKDLDKAIEKADKQVTKITNEPNELLKKGLIVKYKSDRETLQDAITVSLNSMKSVDSEEKYTEAASKVKDTKTLGHIRTGLLAGATLTSAVSTGTSLGATLNAKKLAEKMSSCNAKVSELKIAKNVLEAELDEDSEKPVVIATAQNIIASCTGFDEGNIKTLKNMMTGSTIASYVGTAAAGVGTVASFMANSDKVRNDDDEKGKAKEKRLNTVANVTAGIATGTSATSTTLSAISISKAKKDSETAEKCESAL